MEKWKKPEPFTGVLVEDSEVPFERLAYASTDVYFAKDQVILYGFTDFIPEIVKRMDKKREFGTGDIFPNLGRGYVGDVLSALAEKSEVIEDLKNGRYRAKQTVHVERGWFADVSAENSGKV